MTLRGVEVGAIAESRQVVDDARIRAYAEFSGDHNPVHLDDAAAAATRFGQRIAHGPIALVQLATLMGTELPGPGTVYLEQSVSFRAPVHVGDEVTARVEVVEVDAARARVTLRTWCANQDGVLLVDGEARVLVTGAD